MLLLGLIRIAIIHSLQYQYELIMTNQTIQLAISITGSQKRLADLCGVAQPTVWRWLHGGGIDARYVMKIVSATGGKIKPADIRPDLAPLFNASNSAA